MDFIVALGDFLRPPCTARWPLQPECACILDMVIRVINNITIH